MSSLLDSPYARFIGELCAVSAAVIEPYFANPDLAVELKADQTPVTLADRGAEEVMRALINRRFPGHGIIGEEYGSENADAEWVWVLDPVDGTKAFAVGCPLFGTLIALLHQGRPVLGAINHPLLKKLVLGDGQTTTLNGRPVRVRDCARLEDAILLSNDLDRPARLQSAAGWAALTSRVKTLRTWADCYAYQLLAWGGADIATDPIMSPWDLLALIPVVEGAGGVITDWQGRPAVTGKSIVAAGPRLHGEVIRLLNP